MDSSNRATRIEWFSLRTVQMRTFHLTWLAFLICFFGWFAHAPLMSATIAVDLGLTQTQILIAFMTSVGATVLARLGIGYACDRFGPRRSYVALLIFGALSVAASAFVQTWTGYLISRTCIGVIGAAFVITQYHTSVMFAPNVVGLANATTAGWGNLGGGITQAAMPLLAGLMGVLGLATSEAERWRPAMFFPAAAMLLVAYLYGRYTTDCPEGDYAASGGAARRTSGASGEAFWQACTDYRVWILFLIYGGCFGMELFVNGLAASYYQDRFSLTETSAGMIAALFGMMNLFARSLGGWMGDRFSLSHGLTGRVHWLVTIMVAEGAALLLFSRMNTLGLAVATMLVFSLFVQMAEGATYSVVPFIRPRALGAVSGIVGAGGNVGAVLYAQFLMRSGLPLQDCFLQLGTVVAASGLLGLAIRMPAPLPDTGLDSVRRVQSQV